ncbi:GntR family transcriptional regulator [Actinomadura montaniterrae]|uniref:Winged helix-turn-helix transcriptional regulator n=1 Tax=Actinomadura montaniterrae TaxID=1803903 RepID=A0A6L3VSH4_9ACTN|nr:winged helix-turn-helix domain-containing protein [Actinomadura montaniterrae]KAB2379950.1 winged helix-turn-helix transcriptional regulator [Actinomadura montaniterrae]
MTIDHDGDTPVYRQIAAIIAERIESGDLQPRRRIPSESDLVQEYGVARETARRAVAYLREQGLVYTVPQRGTFVKPSEGDVE